MGCGSRIPTPRTALAGVPARDGKLTNNLVGMLPHAAVSTLIDLHALVKRIVRALADLQIGDSTVLRGSNIWDGAGKITILLFAIVNQLTQTALPSRVPPL